MSTDIVMPFLSETMEEGTIEEWLKKPGDPVAFGEDLVVIATDKANTVYESDAAGVLLDVLVAEGETVSTGTVIARIGRPEELP